MGMKHCTYILYSNHCVIWNEIAATEGARDAGMAAISDLQERLFIGLKKKKKKKKKHRNILCPRSCIKNRNMVMWFKENILQQYTRKIYVKSGVRFETIFFLSSTENVPGNHQLKSDRAEQFQVYT